MVDLVRPLKLENPSDGGTDFDSFPTEVNLTDDYVNSAGFAVKDGNTLIERDSSGNMVFTDAILGSRTLTQLDATSGGSTVITINNNYTASTQNIILCDASSGAFTITLPLASSNTNKVYTIKKIDNTNNLVTIDGNGSETIDDEINQTINKFDSLKIVCNGTGWKII